MRRITQGLVLLLVLGLSVGLMSCGGDDDDEDISGVFQGTVTEADTGRTGKYHCEPYPEREHPERELYDGLRRLSGTLGLGMAICRG